MHREFALRANDSFKEDHDAHTIRHRPAGWLLLILAGWVSNETRAGRRDLESVRPTGWNQMSRPRKPWPFDDPTRHERLDRWGGDFEVQKSDSTVTGRPGRSLILPLCKASPTIRVQPTGTPGVIGVRLPGARRGREVTRYRSQFILEPEDSMSDFQRRDFLTGAAAFAAATSATLVGSRRATADDKLPQPIRGPADGPRHDAQSEILICRLPQSVAAWRLGSAGDRTKDGR